MFERTDRLESLDRRWERQTYADMSFEDALARFEALWAEARLLGHRPLEDWREDLGPDLAIARAVNGLPPS